MDLTSADLDSLSKRDLERLCRKHDLRPYGLKSQLVVRLRAHRTTLLSGDSGVPPASSTSDEPRSSATAVLSPPPSLSPVMTSTPSAPRRDSDRVLAESSAFTPEQQAHIERLIASHIASAGTGAGPSTSTPPSTVPASATLATANHGGVGESTIITRAGECKKMKVSYYYILRLCCIHRCDRVLDQWPLRTGHLPPTNTGHAIIESR